MKSILIFGAGKSATSLIDYLCKTVDEKGWNLSVCDTNLQLAESKIRHCKNASAILTDVSNDQQRRSLVKNADLVISMLPPALHFLVAQDCVAFSRHLLTASYIDAGIKGLETAIKDKGLLFLCEMGLDPGIDHMSAMKIIQRIKGEGGKIVSFKSHCGGLVAPEDDNNPWRYKITWNPGNVVRAGSDGAIFKQDDQIIKMSYDEIFYNCSKVEIAGLGFLAWYPNRDSLHYLKIYELEEARTFIRTTLRYPAFCRGWDKLVNMKLTSNIDFSMIENAKTYAEWFHIKLSEMQETAARKTRDFQDAEFTQQAEFLGLKNVIPLNAGFSSSAGILQNLMEKKLAMQPGEKDMIVMLHEINYVIEGKRQLVKSSLVVEGTESHTAMAKTVGLPLGIAAKLILEEKINITGLHIPIIPEIYEPVLQELQDHDIQFTEKIITYK